MRVVIKEKLLEFTDNVIMGILNITPDSFYSSSRTQTDSELLIKAEKMLADGAEILDIGGYSSRPGAQNISIQEEIERIQPAVIALRKEFPKALLSLDTFRSGVAQVGLDEGIDIINDISAGKLDEKLPFLVAKYKVPYIIMHMKGTPQTMQSQAVYSRMMEEIMQYFSERIQTLRGIGIKDLIVDPGFGFAKTVEDNFKLIQHFEMLKTLDCPLLVGVSRKSFIQKKLNVDADHALVGTSILQAILLQKGAQILRTHDVLQARQAIEMVRATQ